VRVDLVVRRLRAAGDRTIGNVAIVDALPGGFEVENPRLATSAAAAIPGTAREAGRVEFLDDRVVIFADVGSRPLSFSYALRVVASGRFALPPVQASCMYDPALASIHGAARVEVAR
jgi:hypothetical protein